MANVQVLVVEDEVIIAKDIQDMLKKLGYDVSAAASSGEEAIKRVAETLPDLVLMDIVLEGDMDGVAAAEHIRYHFDIPVVYLTAYSDDTTLQRAKITEPYGYILKPFQKKELYTTIEMALYKHKMERKLKENEQWLSTTLKSIGDAVIATDAEGFVTFMNPIAEVLTGWKQEDAGGKPLTDIFDIINEETGKQVEDPVTKILREGVVVGLENHTLLIHKDGTRLPIDDSGAPIRDEKGNIAGVVLVFRDITARRRAERDLQVAYDQSIIYAQELKEQVEERKRTEEEKNKVEAQLIQAQKMEAVGRLAGGVAHDFNNLMAVVIGHSDLMLMHLSKENPLCNNVEEIKKAGNRAASLTQQLLAFSRKQILKPKVINVNEIITNMKNMLGNLIGEDVQLQTALDSELGRVECDPARLEQVIMNLVINARDAMPRGGKITIETTNVDLDETYVSKHGIELKPGSYVLLEVSDTGIGMDKEVQNQIFEPFFTTKEKGKGTGLGLSTVYGIVKQSGGLIWVYSEVGLGTAFKIYLPVVYKELDSVQKEQTPVSDLRGSETILVVEDDDLVRNMTRYVLHGYGYKVLEAASGEEALQISKLHTEPIQLLFTDVIMFKMSGRDLAELVESYRPEIKVLYMSGYTENAVVRHGVLKKDVEFIAKPFSPKGLARKVREVLNTPKND
ncbi:MAG: response regulator [Desulfobacterales bacterium]|nr:response regulator [Desulfobacterales bacterium]